MIIKSLIFSLLSTSLIFGECYDDNNSAYRIQNVTDQALVEPGWGYTYENLISDLDIWKSSPFVSIDTLGTSELGRYIFRITIQDTLSFQNPKIVAMHNRTHPLEVQSWWVQSEMIKYLISDDPSARSIRQQIQFLMVPMLNPDGVNLGPSNPCAAGEGRCNSNGVNLEEQWASLTPQFEVKALKEAYDKQMQGINPIDVVLNMHSAFGCLRYFWYHDEGGTSALYAKKEQGFINSVVSFDQGISPWNTKVSWANGAPDYFPESWFWYQFQESVIALTYEDVKNCESKEKNYDVPAKAIVKGLLKYLTTDLDQLVSTRKIDSLSKRLGRFDIKGSTKNLKSCDNRFRGPICISAD